MNQITTALVISAILSILTAPGARAAEVDTRGIDVVRNKTVLEAADLQVIDDFVASAVKEILRTRDFSQVSKARALVIGKRGTQPQYAQQFADCCKKQIAAGLEQAAANLPADRKFKVMVNLLILADGLQEASLAELGLPYIAQPETVLQYWAIRLVTNSATLEKIKQGNWQPGAQIIARLTGLTQSYVKQGRCPEAALPPIAEFATKIGAAEGQALLLGVADARIAQYVQGQVEGGSVDTAILKFMYAQITSGGDAAKKSAVAARFAQLYSYLVQGLAKSGSRLVEMQRERWSSAIVEVEDKCIGPSLDGYQMPLRKAIEKGDMAALQTEHDKLLGASTSQGQLVAKWQFDYGPGSDGKPRTWPKELVIQAGPAK